MNVADLKDRRARLRMELRRAAWDKIAGDQVLDAEHLVTMSSEYAGGNRGRLLARAFILRGLKAEGIADAAVQAAWELTPDEHTHQLARKLLADPSIAAAVDREVEAALPDSLVTFPGLFGVALARAQADAAAQLR